MLKLNFIDFTYIVDLSILSLIEYLDSVENNLQFSSDGQIFLDLSKKQKDILTSFIIEHILHAYQYNKKNIVIGTCKPQLNWRQSLQKTSIKTYKYKLIDNSIYIDLIKLNQTLDTIFDKLKKINLNKLKYNGILNTSEIDKFTFYKDNLIFLTCDNIDTCDLVCHLKLELANLANYSIISSTCNIIQDGNTEYIHAGTSTEKSLLDIIKQKLISLNVL